jgi:hypothetical protein
MAIKSNVVGWFEIPVEDLNRAINFYESVLGLEMTKTTLEYPAGKVEMAWFPFDYLPGSPGALVKNDKWSKPSQDGPVLYFSSPSGDVENDIPKIKEAGGKIIYDKFHISNDIGYMVVFFDTEGNKLAIHSRK